MFIFIKVFKKSDENVIEMTVKKTKKKNDVLAQSMFETASIKSDHETGRGDCSSFYGVFDYILASSTT